MLTGTKVLDRSFEITTLIFAPYLVKLKTIYCNLDQDILTLIEICYLGYYLTTITKGL